MCFTCSRVQQDGKYLLLKDATSALEAPGTPPAIKDEIHPPPAAFKEEHSTHSGAHIASDQHDKAANGIGRAGGPHGTHLENHDAQPPRKRARKHHKFDASEQALAPVAPAPAQPSQVHPAVANATADNVGDHANVSQRKAAAPKPPKHAAASAHPAVATSVAANGAAEHVCDHAAGHDMPAESVQQRQQSGHTASTSVMNGDAPAAAGAGSAKRPRKNRTSKKEAASR